MSIICYHIHATYYIPDVVDERVTFYDTVLSTPYVIFDGTNLIVVEDPTPGQYEPHIRVAQNNAPYFNLYINNATASDSTGSIDLRIVTADTIPDDEIVAFVSILEDSLPGDLLPWVDFYRVCRQLFQFSVDLTYPDSLDTTITFSHSIPIDKMSTVAFVQDMDTKEVMQSVKSKFEEE